ncbi:MAG: exo-alpha-sialidase [Chlorobi bacterium]|nr:exo-alpha-sialidase [Chlorobiota bacterium]
MKKLFFTAILFAVLLNACEKDEIDPVDEQTDNTSSLVPESWDIQIVDSAAVETSLAEFNKIAVDDNKGVHILYSSEEELKYTLKYAYKPFGGSWTVEILPGTEDNYDISNGADICVTNSEVFVVYNDAQSNEIMYFAHKTIGSGGWITEIYDNNSLSRYPHLFADKNNIVHIVYSHVNYGIYYGQYGQAGHQITDFASYGAKDIVVDKDGTIYVFFNNNDDFYRIYSSDNGTTWSLPTVIFNDDEIEHISAAVDTSGNISVGFSLNQLNDNIDFFYKSYGSTSTIYSKTGLNRVGRLQFELAADLAGRQYFTTYEYSDYYCLQFSEKDRNSSSWSHILLMQDENNRYASCSSVAVDKDAGVHISANGVTDGVSNKLYYLYRENK